MKIENMLQRFSCISLSKPPCYVLSLFISKSDISMSLIEIYALYCYAILAKFPVFLVDIDRKCYSEVSFALNQRLA